MKKYILMAVAGMLVLSSCSNDDNEQTTEKAPRQMTFTAGFGNGAQTRTSLSGHSVSFDAGDKISILSKKNTTTREFTTSESGASADFTGTATEDATYFAIYPYTAGLRFDGTVISGVKIPRDQSRAASSTCGWDPRAPIAYATTTGSNLQFKNMCALLKITNDLGYQSDITIRTSSQPLSGSFELNISNKQLRATSPEIYVFSQIFNGETIYLAVAPIQMEKITAECFWTEHEIMVDHKNRKNKDGVTFDAGKIYDLGNLSDWDYWY